VYRIELHRLLLYQPILRASLQVQQLLTGHITQQTIGHSRPVTRRARHLIHDTGEGSRGEEGDCNLIPASPYHRDGAVYWVSATSDRTDDAAPPPPAGIDNNSLNCQSY